MHATAVPSPWTIGIALTTSVSPTTAPTERSMAPAMTTAVTPGAMMRLRPPARPTGTRGSESGNGTLGLCDVSDVNGASR